MPEQNQEIKKPSSILNSEANYLAGIETITIQISEGQCKYIADLIASDYEVSVLQGSQVESVEVRSLRWLFEELADGDTSKQG